MALSVKVTRRETIEALVLFLSHLAQQRPQFL
jgi:hypothetical protein